MELLRTATMGSRLSISTKVNRDNNNQYQRDSHQSKTLLAAEVALTRSQTIIISKTQDKIRICRVSSNLMATAFHILNSSNRQTRGHNLMDRICCKSLMPARREEPKNPRKSKQNLRMRILNYRSRWELSRQNSPKISLSIRKIFWNSLTVMKSTQNWWRFSKKERLSMSKWREKKDLPKNNKTTTDWASILRHNNPRTPVPSQSSGAT